ncbi:histidine--tRNA ligase [Actinophytocola oryzae]|uniref:Histidine--tRNA ligase n=1 Tax=Actinophytocola oryzae TaxID=502181 RepID=A0A4R7VH82_9PSEU|nr:histidine--tRNA ligase [Actinophytocola oryzae]TDV48682.1 histidyl-tRNA synthetase [Actinophytocola oryzae]
MADSEFTRTAPVSGFPEWLPEVRMVELRWLDRIREKFESYGFAPIETPAAETLSALLKKGETSQEVYTLHRLQDDSGGEAKLGLHFDLTVPFARYVAQHLNDLTFPFKRYQIQKVWRGERPQEGRFREFTQCDIDVINPDHVPLHFDAEVLRIASEVLTELEIGQFVLRVNNRKVLEGFYRGLGVPDPVAVIRVMDKLDKLAAEQIERMLVDQLGLTDGQAKSCLRLAELRGGDAPSVLRAVRDLGVNDELLDEGLEELAYVLDALRDLPPGVVEADLSIARGLDYYTGTVYEGTFTEFPKYGSICSGGRYADLAGAFTRRSLPGVGVSIGLTRIFAKLLTEGRLPVGPKCPTQVLVVVPGQDTQAATAVAAVLRGRGINTEVFHQTAKLAKQLRYAIGKGIPYVWFPPFHDDAQHEVKALATEEQVPADPTVWLP